MQQLPQITPLSQIHTNQEQLLSQLSNGPVVLLQEDKPAAVLVSATEWNRVAKRLELLEQEQRDHMDAERVAALCSDGGQDDLRYFRTQLEKAIKSYRQNLEAYGPLEDRPLLTADEFEQGKSHPSSFISGNELRKVIFKASKKDDAN
jgi:PHD/YefM family antitoxin component YafN of YafNO toxin-antitoxin module